MHRTDWTVTMLPAQSTHYMCYARQTLKKMMKNIVLHRSLQNKLFYYHKMYVYLLSCSIIVSIITLYEIYRLPKYIPIPVILTGYICRFLSYAVCLIIPLDLSGNNLSDNKNKLLDNNLTIFWQCVYWIQICFAYLWIPLIQKYYDNGHDKICPKFKYALKSNIVYYMCMVGLSGLCVCIYSLIYGFTVVSILRISITVSTGYGLVLVIVLLGYGLVSIPKKLWLMTKTKLWQNVCYYNLIDVHYNLENEKEKMIYLSSCQSNPLLDNIIATDNIMATKANLNLTDDTAIHKCTTNTIARYQIFKTEQNQLINEINKHQCAKLYVYRFLCMVCIGLSISIVASTIMSISGVNPHIPTNNVSMIILSVLVIHISYCTHYVLFNIHIPDVYYMHDNITNVGSLLLNSKLLIQLQIPLLYIFVRLLKIENSYLLAFIGTNKVFDIFPIIVVPVSLIFVIDWQNKLVSYFGIDIYNRYIYDDNLITEGIMIHNSLCRNNAIELI
jgi:hypothetical protein